MPRILIPLLLLFSSFSFATANQTVYVYSASSMTQVVERLIEQAQAQGIKVKGVYGSSSSLARQISQGAPADIFISANTQWMDYLEQQVEGVESSITIAGNQLVVVSGNKDVRLDRLDDLSNWNKMLDGQRLAIGESNTVPVGIYAKQALQNLGVWQSLSKQTAPMKNTRAVLAMVERQQVPIGIVYVTDAKQSKQVHIVSAIPTDLYEPIKYPALLLSDKSSANQVYKALYSKEMSQYLLELGFTPLTQ
ncbi:molybdate ABC transporter substrate-binding protein [Vibrio superstes]|uniref:molybdate ABC transporter substrate-binding protein n=1 Tax=Vibrio superstes TaxID=198815 RepID=UPI000E5A2EE9|nr:molybdate ABC transporter substrate-binding protein [Vibrio superstes]